MYLSNNPSSIYLSIRSIYLSISVYLTVTKVVEPVHGGQLLLVVGVLQLQQRLVPAFLQQAPEREIWMLPFFRFSAAKIADATLHFNIG